MLGCKCSNSRKSLAVDRRRGEHNGSARFRAALEK